MRQSSRTVRRPSIARCRPRKPQTDPQEPPNSRQQSLESSQFPPCPVRSRPRSSQAMRRVPLGGMPRGARRSGCSRETPGPWRLSLVHSRTRSRGQVRIDSDANSAQEHGRQTFPCLADESHGSRRLDDGVCSQDGEGCKQGVGSWNDTPELLDQLDSLQSNEKAWPSAAGSARAQGHISRAALPALHASWVEVRSRICCEGRSNKKGRAHGRGNQSSPAPSADPTGDRRAARSRPFDR